MKFRKCMVVAATAALISGGAAQTQAAEAYAYSRQDINNLSISVVEGTFTTNTMGVFANTDTSAQLQPEGLMDGDLGGSDADQAFVSDDGVSPAAENDGSAIGEQSSDFARGDSEIEMGAIGPGGQTANMVDLLAVSEAFVNEPIDSNEERAAGDGSLRFGTEFTVGEGGGMFDVALDYDNLIDVRLEDGTLALQGGSGAAGSFNFNLTIAEVSGEIVADYKPGELNQSISVSTLGSDTIGDTGSLSESFNLSGGQYRLTVSSSSNSAAHVTVIPTPAALPGGLALLSLAGLSRRRRRVA